MGLTPEWGNAERMFADADQTTIDVAMRVPEGPEMLDMLLEVRSLKENAMKLWSGESQEAFQEARAKMVAKIQELITFGNEAIRRYNANVRK